MASALLILSAVAGDSWAAPASAAATFSVPEAALPDPLVLIAYGDMRFTDTAEVHASNPAARQALVAKMRP
jgi:hypothetical protein